MISHTIPGEAQLTEEHGALYGLFGEPLRTSEVQLGAKRVLPSRGFYLPGIAAPSKT